MTKNPARRLGCGDENQIRTHAFFKDLDWKALELRKIDPPFRPKVVSVVHLFLCATIFFCYFRDRSITFNQFRHQQRNPRDALNFDTEFTKEDPVLTPVPNEVLRCINQEEFAGFSFVNGNFGSDRKNC